jgi:hypothetical protein
MTNLQIESPKVSMNSENIQITAQPSINIWKKLRGGFLLVLGYLLSPLCWWNDLLFNLPIAYFFGYLCSLLSPKLLFPCTILGYWLSNIIGILLMQYGSVDMFQKESKERNLKKELFNSFVSSTVYTLVIVLLIQLKIIDTPIFFTNG